MVLGDGTALDNSHETLVDQNRPNETSRKASCLVHGLFQDERLKGNVPTTIHEEHTSRKGDKDPHGHAEKDGQCLASRLLTKKQLSDMAFSIRELSKRLGNHRLKMKVHSVFLLTKAYDESLIALTREVAEWLLSKESGDDYIVWAESTLKDKKTFGAEELVSRDPSFKQRLRYWDNELCQKEPHTFDIIVAVRLTINHESKSTDVN